MRREDSVVHDYSSYCTLRDEDQKSRRGCLTLRDCESWQNLLMRLETTVVQAVVEGRILSELRLYRHVY
jgi:hypothetical protein